jgi:hypothetical protein
MNRPLTISILIACGAIGPLLFIIVFLIEGATRPGYSAWHDYVSSLSLGSQGWMQILTFFVCGFLTLGFASDSDASFREAMGPPGGLSCLVPSDSPSLPEVSSRLTRAWAIHRVRRALPPFTEICTSSRVC